MPCRDCDGSFVTHWLITGAAGMLGQDMTLVLRAAGAQVTALDHAALDITDPDAVSAALHRAKPDLVVNCAAWTAVDEAESQPAQAMAVNGTGAANVAAACAAIQARLVQVSTDYVFAGTGTKPYAECDGTGPRTAYGQTKLAGEQAVLSRLPAACYVLRTAWLYGAGGQCFVRTMIRLEGERDQVEVVADQYGQPTWTVDVARQALALVKADAKPGIYHATASGMTTWHGLAREIFRLLGADPARVTPMSSSNLERPAQRPAYSVLGHDGWHLAGLLPMPAWQESLRQAFPAIAAGAGRVLVSPEPATPAS
jgi:dTDP-4-dehydrorhamnose reductase